MAQGVETVQTEEFLGKIRGYFDSTLPVVLKACGPTYQAGLYKGKDTSNPAAANNLFLASRAGVRPGLRILDAGCGAGGPAVDIAKAYEGVTVRGITISPAQAEEARNLVRREGLEERVELRAGDYHSLPYESGSFDVALLLECTSYSPNLARLFAEVYRVLAPGGTIYVKEVFLKEGPLTQDERKEIEEFDRMFVLYRTYPRSEGARLLEKTGFRDVRSASLDDVMTTDFFIKAMFEFDRRGVPSLTEFGKLHFREFKCLPTTYGELRATKPG